jgi:hypothetical protein
MVTATAQQAEARKLMGTCSLTLRINKTHYSVRGFSQTQSNWAWELRKLGTGKARVVYTVIEFPGDDPVCDCPSFVHRGPERACKHIRALAARGLIRPIPTPPAPRGLDGPAFDAEEIDAAVRQAAGLVAPSGRGTADHLLSPSKLSSLRGVGRVRDEFDAITPEVLEDLARDSEGQAEINQDDYPVLAARQRKRAADLRQQAARLRSEAETAAPAGPISADTTPNLSPSFTLPDDIVAPDAEPFALASLPRGATPDATPPGEYSPIVALLRGARERGLKYPSIEIRTPHGMPVVLKLCGGKSRTPGSVNVTNGVKYGEPNAEYFGRIDEWGRPHGNLATYEPSDPIEWGVIEALRRLASDPAAVAAEHGHATGRCCFCGRELTDPKSVQVGYGPICADRHALPWG